MDDETAIEVTGESIEDAVAEGLDRLGVSRSEVDIEVLEEDSDGLEGPAVVRLSLKAGNSSSERRAEAGWGDDEEEDEDVFLPAEHFAELKGDDSDDNPMVAIARTTVKTLLEMMNISARVVTRMGEPDEEQRLPVVLVDILGNDLSILLGRRAETLNALQFITRLIVGKELGKSISINIDVQGYRARQEIRLRQLARNIARQAIETGRTQSLEPMAPNERRIIHLELRDHAEVFTESVGEGNRRKVTIVPK